jgi:hypothetical protein
MNYLLTVIDDGTGAATPVEDAAIDVFNDKLRAEGHWVFAGGLGAADDATTIDARTEVVAAGGEPIVTDGPFVESKEYLAGFWIISAPTLELALALGAEGSRACNRKIEVRPFIEP